MDAYRDFTIDDSKERYKGLGTFVEQLKLSDMHYVPILDAGIAIRKDGSYHSYTDGENEDVYMKINDNKDLIANVWPKDAAFPDFTK